MVTSRPRWLGIHGGATAEEARVAFVRIHGYEPKQVKRSGPIWLVGPLREEEAGRDERVVDRVGDHSGAVV